MRKCLFIILFFAVFCSFADENAKREEKLALSLSQYPAVIAEFGNHKLLKKDGLDYEQCFTPNHRFCFLDESINFKIINVFQFISFS